MTITTAATGIAGLAPPRRQLAMLTISLGVVLSSLDGAMANIALPAIAKDLAASASDSVWVATAYQLAVVVGLLPFSVAGEAFGYKRIYLGGMAIFTAASLACALSPTLPVLVAMRALQGLAGGAMVGVSLALVRFTYPKERLGRALSLYALTAAAGLTAGPSIAGAILAVGDWPWLFAVNVPIGVVAVALGLATLPATARHARRIDVPGALTTAAVLILTISGFGALGDPRRTWQAAAAIAAGLALAVVLVRQQGRKPTPLVPVDLLRKPVFSLSAATAVCVYAAQTAAFVALPFHLQLLLGRSEVETGLLITPFPAMIVAMAPLVGRLADRHSAAILGSLGIALLVAGLASLAFVGPRTGALDIALRMAVCGVGFALFQAPNNRAIMGATPPERSGAASAMVALARVSGQAFGSAAAAVALGLFAAKGPIMGLWAAFAFAVAGGAMSASRLGKA
jgi:DHA2 family multidrug resistance protein-like MFS transporter